MKYTIYVMRHQRPGSMNTNCVSPDELQNTNMLAETVRTLNVHRVFTCLPNASKHIRPLQTASNLCAITDKHLECCDGVDSLPMYVHGNILVVWHHSEMNEILNHFGMVSDFEWPVDNYDGCLSINEFGWEYAPAFFSNTPWYSWFCL